MKKDFLLLIDGSSLLSTQYFGNLPNSIKYAKTKEERAAHFNEILHTSTGIYTNGVYGFMKSLLKIIKEQNPSHIAVAWDITRDTFRRRISEDYKANRDESDKPLIEQYKTCQNLLDEIGIKQFYCREYEADDYCGSLAKKFENQIPIKIITKDRDYFQLVNDNTQVWLITNTKKKTEELCKKHGVKQNLQDKLFELTPELINAEYGFYPEVVPMLKGLMGDASDNIKGIPGVGEKTAIILANEFKTIDNLYDKINKLSEDELKDLKIEWKKTLGLNRCPLPYLLAKSEDGILKGEEAGRLSERLATIFKDIDLSDTTLEILELSLDSNIVRKELNKLEITSIKF